MSKTDPSTMTDEEKLEAYRKAGLISTDEEADTTPPKKDVVETTTDEDTDTSTVTKTADEVVDKPAETNTKESETSDPANPNKDGADKSTEFKPRPSKYIPLPQYQDEKKSWETEKATMQAKIAELQSATTKETTDGTKENDAFITEYAEKYGMEESDVRKLVAMVTPKQTLSDEALKTLENLAKKNQENETKLALMEEEKHFNTEFDRSQNVVKEYFPNLTDAQAKALKQSVFELSHTAEWHDKDLDYVLYKNKDTLLASLPTEDSAKAPKGRTAESGRSGNHVHKSITAEDFKDGKTSFDELGNLDESERSKIIADMDPQTYRKFVTYSGSFQDNGGLKVNRGGKTVILK